MCACLFIYWIVRGMAEKPDGFQIKVTQTKIIFLPCAS
jgi:hypothetical protein